MKATVLSLAIVLSLQPFVQGDLISDLGAVLNGTADCSLCPNLLAGFKGIAAFGDGFFVQILTNVCKSQPQIDKDVCEGTVKQQGPALAHALRSTFGVGDNAQKFCSAVFGICPQPAVTPFNVTFPKRTPKHARKWKSKGRKAVKVVHFTDSHVDRKYTPGSEAACTKPICCRADPLNQNPISTPAGAIASRRCDTSPALLRALLSAANSKNPAWSIFTGDVIDSALWEVTAEGNARDLALFNNDTAKYLKGPVYPAVGNHESAPSNMFPRSNSTAPASSFQWIYDTLSVGWKRWIGTKGANQVKDKSGSYAVVVPHTDLKIISINTQYWMTVNFYLYDSDTPQPDPNGVLAFLVEQLQAAEDAGQRAWIVGHMAPGTRDTLHDQSNYFDQVVQRYQNTIAAQFYGHSHSDEFAVGYSNYSARSVNTASSIAFIAPAMTPREANPAYKVYEVDPDTYEVMDAHTYVGDISEAGWQTKPTFRKLYSARNTYAKYAGKHHGWPDHSPLNAEFWHKVTEAFVSDDKLFQKFISLRRTNTPGTAQPCDSVCKEKTICGLRALRAQDNCFVPKPGLPLRRRFMEAPFSEEGAHHGTDRCEGLSIASILSGMVGLSPADATAMRFELERLLKEKLAT